jgi:hypothetical protein
MEAWIDLPIEWLHGTQYFRVTRSQYPPPKKPVTYPGASRYFVPLFAERGAPGHVRSDTGPEFIAEVWGV